MMKDFDESVKINHNLNWTFVPEHPYRILFITRWGSGKNNVLLNLMMHQREDVLTNFIYIWKICSNQSINCVSTEEEKLLTKQEKKI